MQRMTTKEFLLTILIIIYQLIMFYLSKTNIYIDTILTLTFLYIFLRMKRNERKMLKLILAVPLLIPVYFLNYISSNNQVIVDLWRYFAIICILFDFAFDYIDEWLVLHRAYLLGVLIIVLELIGTIGFMKFEHYSLAQGLWLTFISATTVGYGDISATTTAGQIVSVFVIIFGTLTYGALLIGFILSWLKSKEEHVRYQLMSEKDDEFKHEIAINDLFNQFKAGEMTISQLENKVTKLYKKKH